jgi:hypothetical protein
MKLFASILLIALLSFVAGLYLPWWSIAIAAFLVSAIIHQGAGKAFLSGFLALFLLWGGLAWYMDMKNQGILSAKIAAILPLGGSSILLVLVTALVGALVAGFAAMSGSYLRSNKA